MYDGHHLLAFSAALATGATDAQVAAVPETQYNSPNSNFQIPEPAMVLMAVGSGVNISRLRINCGSLLQRGLPQIFPLSNTFLLPDNLNIEDQTDYPIPLRQEEELRVDATHTDAGTQTMTAGLWIATKPTNRNINSIGLRWVRATVSLTGIVSKWSASGSLIFADTLEGGKYNIYGLDVVMSNGVLARLILQNQWNRPGCPVRQTVNYRGWSQFKGGLGLFGQFSTYSVPQLEVLCSSTATVTAEVKLLIGKAA